MADDIDEQEIVVAIEPEPTTGTTDETVTKAAGEKAEAKRATPADDLKEQFKELQGQAERERTAREDAERRERAAVQEASAARRDATAARSEAVESQYDTVTSGLAAAESEAKAGEQEYKTAYEAGDAAGMASAQRKIARAEAKSVRLDEAKAELESRKTRAAENGDARAKPADTTAPDPVEAYIANRSAPTAQWLRAHKDWVTDTKKNAKLTAAHFDAVSDGIAVDSPEYFTRVETFIGLRKAEESKPNGKGGSEHVERGSNGQFKPARKVAAPVAPGASSGGGINGGGREVRLTPAEARAAQDGTVVWNTPDPSGQNRWKVGDPVGITEYARRKLSMQTQGHYDKMYTES